MQLAGLHRESRLAIGSLFTAVMLLCWLPAQAQSFGGLQNLVFHPVPLPTAERCTETPLNAGCHGQSRFAEEEVVDMAMFEEIAIEDYLENIEEVEAAGGSYAAELIERFLSLGLLYQQQGLHEDAILYLGRAAAAGRIHDGPWSIQQIELVKHIIPSLVALARFDEVTEKYTGLVNLNLRVHGKDAPQAAKAMLRLGQWEVEYLHRRLLQGDRGQVMATGEPGTLLGDQQVLTSNFGGLYRAQALYVDAVKILLENEAWTDPAIFEIEQGLIRTFYIDANRQRYIDDPRSFEINGSSARAGMHARVNQLALPPQYRNGEQAYLRMIGYLKKDADATIDNIAAVMGGLADWHLLFGQYVKADKQYQQLESFLVSAKTPAEEIAAIMNPELPHSVPGFLDSVLAGANSAGPDAFAGYVDVQFELGRHGTISRLDVLGAAEGTSPGVVHQLVNLLRGARFRPGYKNSANYEVRYYYTH